MYALYLSINQYTYIHERCKYQSIYMWSTLLMLSTCAVKTHAGNAIARVQESKRKREDCDNHLDGKMHAGKERSHERASEWFELNYNTLE